MRLRIARPISIILLIKFKYFTLQSNSIPFLKLNRPTRHKNGVGLARSHAMYHMQLLYFNNKVLHIASLSINKSVSNKQKGMFQEKALLPDQLPINQKNRKSTDLICTIVGAAFAITMFVVACVFWNRDKFQQNFFNHYTNEDGQNCKESNVLFTNPQNATIKYCINTCPQGYFAYDRVCLPESKQMLKTYLANPDIGPPIQYSQFKWVLFYTFIVALSAGFAWAALVQCFPRIAPIVAHLLAIAALIALGVLTLVLYDNFWNNIFWLKITVPVVIFIMAIISLVMLCFYANQVKIQGLFLDYAGRFLNKNPATILYLPIYLIFMTGLVALIVWQHCCFTSQFASSRNFFNFNNTGVWQILNILQFIWAAQFLRDSFNFCVSGNACDYYWREPGKSTCFSSYSRLLCNHWGSVVGGSFLNAFFQIPTLLAQLLTCHPTACCAKMGATCYNSCGFLTCFFDLVRTDSYSYINIASIPFCNASRECKKICLGSRHFVGYHSPMKHYRYAAHVFLVTAVFIAAWFILRARVWNYGFWNLALLISLIYITVTLFVGIHADAAQGLQTSYLCEHQLQPTHNLMQRLHPAYIQQLDQWQRRQETDGNC